MQHFTVSIFAGVLFPVLPILAEFGLTNKVKPETLTLTAVVYAAAIGLVSRNQAILISSLFCSTVCAVIYGAAESGLQSSVFFIKHGPTITAGTIYFYSACYIVERFGRHCIEYEPFLEF
ncbi:MULTISPECIES: hypothetical protein [unclassified Bradyrhizobium]